MPGEPAQTTSGEYGCQRALRASWAPAPLPLVTIPQRAPLQHPTTMPPFPLAWVAWSPFSFTPATRLLLCCSPGWPSFLARRSLGTWAWAARHTSLLVPPLFWLPAPSSGPGSVTSHTFLLSPQNQRSGEVLTFQKFHFPDETAELPRGAMVCASYSVPGPQRRDDVRWFREGH